MKSHPKLNHASNNEQEISHTHKYPEKRQGWKTVSILSLLYLVAMMDRNIIVLLADSIGKDLGINDLQLSILFGAAFSISFAIGTIPIGWAVDRFPRRNIIYICVMFWSLATVICGTANSFAMMLLGRSGVGAGEAGLVPGANSMLSDTFPPDRLSFPISIYMASAKIGQSLSLLISASLASIIVPGSIYYFGNFPIRGWQAILLIVAFPGFILASTLFLIKEPDRRYSRGSVDTGYLAFIRYVRKNKRLFFTAYSGTIVYAAVPVAVISWSPAFLQRVHGMSVGESGLLLGATLLVSVITGAPLHGWHVDRQIARGVSDAHLRHMMWMGLLATPVGIAAFFAPNAIAAAVLVGIFMFVISGFSSLTSTAVLLFNPPELRGKATSVLLLINTVIGVSSGPLIAAILSEKLFNSRQMIGASLAIEIAILIPIASILFSFCLHPIREQHKFLKIS